MLRILNITLLLLFNEAISGSYAYYHYSYSYSFEISYSASYSSSYSYPEEPLSSISYSTDSKRYIHKQPYTQESQSSSKTSQSSYSSEHLDIPLVNIVSKGTHLDTTIDVEPIKDYKYGNGWFAYNKSIIFFYEQPTRKTSKGHLCYIDNQKIVNQVKPFLEILKKSNQSLQKTTKADSILLILSEKPDSIKTLNVSQKQIKQDSTQKVIQHQDPILEQKLKYTKQKLKQANSYFTRHIYEVKISKLETQLN